MGGLPRRATFISRESRDGIPTLLLDSGNLFTEGPLPDAAMETVMGKARLIMQAMERMGYAAAALGEMDLYLGLENLRALEDATDVTFLSANLTDGEGRPLFTPHLVLETGSLRVGVIGLTPPPGNRNLFIRRMGEAGVGDPLQAAREAVGRLREKTDLLVVLSALGYEQDLELARSVEGIDVIIGGRSKRYLYRPLIEKRTLITSGFYQGRSVGRLLVRLDGTLEGWVSRQDLEFLDRQVADTEAAGQSTRKEERLAELRARREAAGRLTVYDGVMVNLDPSYPDDAPVAGMIADYRKKLVEQAGTPKQAESGVVERVRFTGADACSRCHEARHRFWARTPHAGAFEALAPRNAQADPDCLPCHVTGYRLPTGYDPRSPRADLRGVQCESCHGVGSLHADSPETYALVNAPTAPQCLDCHTKEQDDDFDYMRDRVLVCKEE